VQRKILLCYLYKKQVFWEKTSDFRFHFRVRKKRVKLGAGFRVFGANSKKNGRVKSLFRKNQYHMRSIMNVSADFHKKPITQSKNEI